MLTNRHTSVSKKQYVSFFLSSSEHRTLALPFVLLLRQ
ncbi:hypothetical protein EVA_14080 [gut metagenome]|uniref:Uncharacterized protein n=1 Tax=gut metagenome TaxID=749906 RepID=J9FTI2_9ZZZZ